MAAYEMLRDVVLPPARPTEIFLYDPTTTRPGRAISPTAKPGTVVKMLIRRAVATGKVEDLRQRVTARQESPAVKRLLEAIEEAAK